MNKKLIFGIGIGLAVIVGLIIFLKPGIPQIDNPLSLKKEVKVGQDVCGEFSKEWVASVINKIIIKSEKSGMSGLYVCQYFVDENNFVTLRLNELSFENQKKGQESLGRSITTNAKIPLNHFIALQGNNLINDVVLEINPNLFLAVDRSSTKAANETEIVDFAIKVAERISSGENQGTVPSLVSEPTKKSGANIVPLPQETDIVNNFFQLIAEGKPSDAVMMMTSNITGNEGVKQEFGVQFKAMNSVKVTKIEESSKADWTDTNHQYMVTLDVEMDPSSANEPIPFYGFDKGENVRFINLVKEGSNWKINGLSTGP